MLGVVRRPLEVPGPVPVRLGFEGLEHLCPACLAEVPQAVAGRAVEGHPAARDQHEQAVTHVQVNHAVRDDDHGPAVLGQPAHQLHHGLVQPGVQAGRGLVQEQQGRLGEQLERHVDPLLLAARHGRGPGVAVRGERKLVDDLIHPALTFRPGGVTGKPQLGSVTERPLRLELVVQDVVLRDQADPVPQLRVVGVQVAVVVQDGALGRGSRAGQRAEQGRLARAAGSDDPDQGSLRDREAHVVEQDLATGQAHREVLGHERDVTLVDELAELVTDQAEGSAADTDQVLLGHRGGPRDQLAVDEGAVVAAQVGDLVPAAAEVAELGVYPGHAEVGDHQVVLRGPADAQQPGGRAPHRGRAAVHTAHPGVQDGAPGPGPVHRAHHHRPVIGMTETQDAVLADLNLADAPGAEEGSVGAAGVLEDPRVTVDPEHGVPPGDAGVVDHDVGLRVTADPVLRASTQCLVGSLGLHHEHRGVRRRHETVVHWPSVWRFNPR